MKWAGRLHTCHNEYVFAMLEANHQQQAAREHVMPQLLDAQQELQEYYVEDWSVHTLNLVWQLNLVIKGGKLITLRAVRNCQY